jgi:glycerol-3-phosphate dehydrogenase
MVDICDFSIHPRKGEYLLFDKTAATGLGQGSQSGYSPALVIFQAPNEHGKGVVVAPTVHGNAYAGPTAFDMTDKYDKTTTAEGLEYTRRQAERSVVSLPWRNVITSFAGVRAMADTDDFIIRRDGHVIQAAGICSPGLSSAPAIAAYVAELVGEVLSLPPNSSYSPERLLNKRFAEMDTAEKAAAIADDPKQGNIICRCETITEAEIIDAIKRGAKTVDAVKRRVRAGMGRCQGGFCMSKVISLIAEHTGIPITDVTKFGGDSKIIMCTKGITE